MNFLCTLLLLLLIICLTLTSATDGDPPSPKCTHSFKFDDPASFRKLAPKWLVVALKVPADGRSNYALVAFGATGTVAEQEIDVTPSENVRLMVGKGNSVFVISDKMKKVVVNEYEVGQGFLVMIKHSASWKSAESDVWDVIYHNGQFIDVTNCTVLDKIPDEPENTTVEFNFPIKCEKFCAPFKQRNDVKGDFCLYDPFDKTGAEYTKRSGASSDIIAVLNCVSYSTYKENREVVYLMNPLGMTGDEVVCLQTSESTVDKYTQAQFFNFYQEEIPCDYGKFVSRLFPGIVTHVSGSSTVAKVNLGRTLLIAFLASLMLKIVMLEK